MKLIFWCLLLTLFYSCASQKRCAKLFPPQVEIKDSVIEKETIVYRDTTITIPADSVGIHDTIPCPDVVYNKKVVSSSGKITAAVNIKNGKIIVDCKADSLQREIDSLTTITRQKEKYRTVTTVIEKPVEVVKTKVPRWVWWLVAFNVLYFAIKYRSKLKIALSWLVALLKKFV